MADEVKAEVLETNAAPGQIFSLIGKAMREIGAIGKDSESKTVSGKVMYKFRGIDAVYNALNPVMAKYGLFICPEILEQKRENRATANGGNLIYTILTIKYTMYAPDGSYVQMTVVGEGMDSGDKSTNKAMSAALKYCCFQTFMIPTEEMKDADEDTHDNVLPVGVQPKQAAQQAPRAAQQPVKAQVTTSATVPPTPPADAPKPPDLNTAKGFLQNEMAYIGSRFGLDKKEAGARFQTMRNALIAGGLVEDIKSEEMTLEQAKTLVAVMHKEYLDEMEQTA